MSRSRWIPEDGWNALLILAGRMAQPSQERYETSALMGTERRIEGFDLIPEKKKE
jgi:hypothetical protein